MRFSDFVSSFIIVNITTDMEKFINISFSDDNICVTTDAGRVYRKALEFFPSLKDALAAQRERYQINKFGDAVDGLR